MQTLDFLISIAYFTKKKESEKVGCTKRRKKFTAHVYITLLNGLLWHLYSGTFS